MSASRSDRAATSQEISEASELLDAHLKKLIVKSQRLLITIIIGQALLLIALGIIAFTDIHNQADYIQQQVYKGQHDACAIFLQVALGGYSPITNRASVQGIEAARKIYVTRKCGPPALPPIDSALQAAAAKYGVQLTY